MMTKTEWLDWVEAGADLLQQRYREAWPRLPNSRRSAPRRAEHGPEPKRWSAIRAEIDREPREVVVHLELPEPHTSEAAVRVIGQTLAIAVLRSGSDIDSAPIGECYRRAIPLPPQVDPASAMHKVHGDELMICLQPAKPKRQGARTKSRAPRKRPAKQARSVTLANVTQIKRSKQAQRTTA